MPNDDPVLRMDDKGLELFRQCSLLCEGFTVNDVINAASAMLTNAVRQGFATSQEAENEWDRMMTRSKENLMNSYNGNGTRRQIFPHTQHVHVDNINNFHGPSLGVSEVKQNSDPNDPYRTKK